jgi:hypothetical protein
MPPHLVIAEGHGRGATVILESQGFIVAGFWS